MEMFISKRGCKRFKQKEVEHIDCGLLSCQFQVDY